MKASISIGKDKLVITLSSKHGSCFDDAALNQSIKAVEKGDLAVFAIQDRKGKEKISFLGNIVKVTAMRGDN